MYIFFLVLLGRRVSIVGFGSSYVVMGYDGGVAAARDDNNLATLAELAGLAYMAMIATLSGCRTEAVIGLSGFHGIGTQRGG